MAGSCGQWRGNGRWRLARRRARRARCWGGYWRWFAGPAPAQANRGGEVRLMLGDDGVASAGRALAL